MDKESLKAIVSKDCYDKLDNIFEMINAPYFVANGMVSVSISNECVETEMKCLPEHLNSNGFAHGGVIYGGMDHCYATLANINGHVVGQS